MGAARLRAARGDFGQLDRSGERMRAQAFGTKVSTVKRLHETVAQKIDATNASFWSVKNNSGRGTGNTGHRFGLMERQRLKMWLNHAASGVAAIDV